MKEFFYLGRGFLFAVRNSKTKFLEIDHQILLNRPVSDFFDLYTVEKAYIK